MYYSVFRCDDCRHEVQVGFVGGMHWTVVFCTACAASFRVSPSAGEELLKSAAPHHLLVFGKTHMRVSSKKGRIVKDVQRHAWVESGIRIPVDEGLRQFGDAVHITYALDLRGVSCPDCGVTGAMREFREYLARCPQCASSAMHEYDL